MAKRALIVVDVQNDFCDLEGSALPVEGGVEAAAQIAEYLHHGASYDAVVATRDWHIDPGPHFSEQPDFVDTWPAHCVAASAGAAFHPALDLDAIDAVFSKGAYSASYTGFDGVDDDGTALARWLEARDIEEVDVVGLATDHCVRATALDAVKEGFKTRVLLPLCRGVAPETTDRAIEQMSATGVLVEG